MNIFHGHREIRNERCTAVSTFICLDWMPNGHVPSGLAERALLEKIKGQVCVVAPGMTTVYVLLTRQTNTFAAVPGSQKD